MDICKKTHACKNRSSRKILEVNHYESSRNGQVSVLCAQSSAQDSAKVEVTSKQNCNQLLSTPHCKTSCLYWVHEVWTSSFKTRCQILQTRTLEIQTSRKQVLQTCNRTTVCNIQRFGYTYISK